MLARSIAEPFPERWNTKIQCDFPNSGSSLSAENRGIRSRRNITFFVEFLILTVRWSSADSRPAPRARARVSAAGLRSSLINVSAKSKRELIEIIVRLARVFPNAAGRMLINVDQAGTRAAFGGIRLESGLRG